MSTNAYIDEHNARLARICARKGHERRDFINRDTGEHEYTVCTRCGDVILTAERRTCPCAKDCDCCGCLPGDDCGCVCACGNELLAETTIVGPYDEAEAAFNTREGI